MTYIRKGRTFEENAIVIKFFYKEAEKTRHTSNGNRASGLTRDGTKVSSQRVIDGNCLIADHLTTEGKSSTDLHFLGNYGYKHRK